MTEQKIFDYLVSNGLTKEGAAGLMGNLYAESGLSSINLQNSFNKKIGISDEQYTAMVDNGSYTNFIGDSAGYGLAQWTFWSRKQKLLEYARQRGVSIGDMDMQLSFLLQEISAYGKLWSDLRTTNDIDALSDEVLTTYERPADMSEEVKKRRRKYSRDIYNRCTSNASNTSVKITTVDNADSPLVSVTCWTSKHSGIRVQPISKITIHHMAGVSSAENCMKGHKNASRKVSANYYIGKDGEIGQAVPESCRAWTSSSSWNDNRAITIETSNSAVNDLWPISGTVYQSLINLCADICKRNGIKEVHYTGDKEGSLTIHSMFAATVCPGPTIKNLLETHQIENDINNLISFQSSLINPISEFRVRVSIPDLNIRKGPGTNYDIVQICPQGIFTIIETSSGKGSSKGWGKLKSGIGWISLGYAERV